MATLYERSFVGAQPGSGATGPIAALRAGTIEIRVREFQVTIAGSGLAGGETVGLFRTTAVGTATTSGVGQAVDPADAVSITNVDTAWSVNPTPATNALRNRGNGPNNYDQWWVHWHEQDGLVIPASGSIVFWRISNPASVMSATFGTWSWEE